MCWELRWLVTWLLAGGCSIISSCRQNFGKRHITYKKNFWACGHTTTTFQHPFKGRKVNCPTPFSLFVRLIPLRLIPTSLCQEALSTQTPLSPLFFLPSLSARFTVAPTWLPVNLISLDILHSPRPAARVCSFYSCLMSRGRGLNDGKLNKCLENASNPSSRRWSSSRSQGDC